MSDAQPPQNRVPFYEWFLLILVGIAVVVGVIVLLTDEDEPTTITINPPLPTSTHPPPPTATQTATLAPLEVYVTGAVAQPESRLTLPPGARVEDALEAAGGALPDADLSRVNLAARVQDGDQIHVPGTESETVARDETPTPNAPRQIDLNTATQPELETLPGIGPARAQDILAYRDENGPFAEVDELLNVSGIGPATLDDLRPFIRVD